MLRREGELVLGLFLAVVALAACGGGGSTSSSPARSDTMVGVDVRTETFVDTSRGTAAGPDQPATSSRTLKTAIFIPRGPAARPAGGRSLIVFAHGSGGDPEFYRVLLEAWAENGYVVAAPRFPPGREDHTGDVSFVISELLRLSSTTKGPYAGLVDGTRIGVAGHSAGGVTVLGVGFNTCCIDRRVRAGAVLAADAPPSRAAPTSRACVRRCWWSMVWPIRRFRSRTAAASSPTRYRRR